MEQSIVDRVKNSPKFEKLVKERSSFGWKLSIAMLVVYYAFIMIIAFSPATLGTPMSEGATTSIGIPVGIAIIFFAFIITGIYVRRANSEFDQLTNEIKKEATGE
jgi:uncharacterized membrane protein (DUF485 family)